MSHAASTRAVAVPAVGEPALLDRRLQAWLLDRVLLWGGCAVVAGLASRVVPGGAAIGVGVLALLLTWLIGAVGVARSGATPGRRLAGVRVVDARTGLPVGLRRSLARAALLAPAVAPTVGVGAACLAWSAATDPRRRAWHDRLVGTVVVDVRAAAPASGRPGGPGGPGATAPAPARGVPVVAPALPADPPTVDLGLLDVTGRRAGGARAWRLLVDTGEAVVLEGRTLLGRAPEPRGAEAVVRAVALPSADHSLSKTHAVLDVVPGGGLVVSDRGSTNGTFVVRGDDVQRVADAPLALREGDLLRVGDRAMRVVQDVSGAGRSDRTAIDAGQAPRR